jgi:glycerol-3-phosphate dehydrogenase
MRPEALLPATPVKEENPEENGIREGIGMKRFIEDLRDGDTFDVVVIGGGITGAAVAYEAASRGLSVALLEKKDFGWATSAATSKLIHGGLRYLQNMEFGLVRESLRERKNLLNIAPNLLYPIPFLVPGYNDAKRNKWILRAGLTLYDLLAFDKGWTWDPSKKIRHHSWVSTEKILEMEPDVRAPKMHGGSIYYDCQSINPERLTLAFVKSAVKYGARTANYTEVKEFLFADSGRVEGVRVEDLLSGARVEVRGDLVINCGGPWADIVLQMADRGNGKHQIKRSEGIHIITRKLKSKQAVVMWTPSGRHFFMIPWRGLQLIGTTDKEYVGDPDRYRVTRKSIEALIQDTNDSIGDGSLTYEDVVFAYGGLRPLVDEQTEGTYESSRKYEIYDNAENGIDGLVTVEGGKYTTSRHLAMNVVRVAEKKLNRPEGKSITHREYLAGCEIPDMESFMRKLDGTCGDFSEATRGYLGRNYGMECRDVLDIARQEDSLSEVLNGEGQLLASAAYAIRREMARTLNDILFRRTGLGNVGHPGAEVLGKVADLAARELGWDDAKRAAELAAAEEALRLPDA